MIIYGFVIAVMHSRLKTLRIKQCPQMGALFLPEGLSQGGPLPPVLL